MVPQLFLGHLDINSLKAGSSHLGFSALVISVENCFGVFLLTNLVIFKDVFEQCVCRWIKLLVILFLEERCIFWYILRDVWSNGLQGFKRWVLAQGRYKCMKVVLIQVVIVTLLYLYCWVIDIGLKGYSRILVGILEVLWE